MSSGAKNGTDLLTLESIFVMSSDAKNDILELLTLESFFVMSSGAKNDNVNTNFGVIFNICLVLQRMALHSLTFESILVMQEVQGLALHLLT